MKRILAGLFITLFFLCSTVNLASAGHRYYGSGWRHHNPHYSHHYSSYHSGDIWAGIGIALLTGAFVSAMTAPPRPVQRTVVYTAPPPVIVQSQPVVIRQQVVSLPSYDATEHILRRVTITPDSLNMRLGPGLENEVVGRLYGGTVVGVVGAAPEWLYIKTQSGQYGWIMTQYTDSLEGLSVPVG